MFHSNEHSSNKILNLHSLLFFRLFSRFFMKNLMRHDLQDEFHQLCKNCPNKSYLIHSSAFFFRLIDEKCTVSIYTHWMINIRLYLYCFYNLYNIASHRSHVYIIDWRAGVGLQLLSISWLLIPILVMLVIL